MQLVRTRFRRRYQGAAVMSLICLSIASFLYIVYINNSCSDTEVHRNIAELCSLYKRGNLSGDLCVPLCDDEAIRIIECLSNPKKSKFVVRVQWEGADVILKAKHFNISEYEKDWAVAYDSENLDSYRKSILMLLTDTHGLSIKRDEQEAIVDRLWSETFKWKESKKPVMQAAMRSLWSLLNSDEYARLRIYRGFMHVPHSYGTCGFVYSVASVPLLSVLSVNPFQIFQHTWSDRVRAAQMFLELIENLKTQFPEPMHLCDVQPSNFGQLSEYNDRSLSIQQQIIGLIDMDFLYTDSYVKTFNVGSACKFDSDCNFFDCHGRCVSSKCTGERKNNNLQAICENIFATSWKIGRIGLLSNAPESIRKQIDVVLNSCIYPDLSDKSERTPIETLHKIRSLLKDSFTL